MPHMGMGGNNGMVPGHMPMGFHQQQANVLPHGGLVPQQQQPEHHQIDRTRRHVLELEPRGGQAVHQGINVPQNQGIVP